MYKFLTQPEFIYVSYLKNRIFADALDLWKSLNACIYISYQVYICININVYLNSLYDIVLFNIIVKYLY